MVSALHERQAALGARQMTFMSHGGAQAQPGSLCHPTPPFVLTAQPQNNDVTDIIIDDSPAPMEVEEAPNVHDCELHPHARRVRLVSVI